MFYSHINLVVFLLTSLVLRHCDTEVAADLTSQIKDYDNKVCNNEPTCSLTTTIPNLGAEKLIFPHRDCMCDAECSEYEDCCQDSQYIKKPKLNNPPKTYYCSPDAKVYMVVSCIPNFADERIKANCAKAFKPLDRTNFALILPVTNIAKHITYANAYCALCNEDKDFTPWTYLSGCGEPSKEALEQRATEVKKESSSNEISTSTSKPNNNRLNINIHLNPGAIFGKKEANGGYSKTIALPTFSPLGAKLANKTVGSELGFFNIKTVGRSKRNSDLGSIDFYAYAKKLNEIMKVVKYDPAVRELIAKFEDKTLVCKLGSKMPSTVGKAVRNCVPNVISECSDGGEANKECQSSMRLVHDTSTKKSYRNIDCAICNGVDPTTTMLKGCQMSTRSTGGSSLWGVEGKGNPNDEACKDPALAAKFC